MGHLGKSLSPGGRPSPVEDSKVEGRAAGATEDAERVGLDLGEVARELGFLRGEPEWGVGETGGQHTQRRFCQFPR